MTVQLALSCGALVAAGLTGQSIAGSRDFGKGVPSDEILMAAVDVAPVGGGGVAAPGRLDALEAEFSALPAVRGAALALGAPGYRERYGRVEVQGREARAGDPPVVRWNAVSSGFFDALDVALLVGRGIEPSDVPGSEPVAVVSESFARVWSADAPVLGRALRLPSADSTALFTVVGVVEDAPMSPGAPMAQDARVYLSVRQVPGTTLSVLLRSEGDVARLTPELRRAVATVSPDMAVWDVRTLADGHAYMVRVPRAFSAIAAAGGAAGLLVAAVGLYGLLAFRVRQRRRELGVRLALGADGRRLAGEILGLAARQIVPAMVVGMGVAWLISPVLGAILMGLDPRAPGVYVAVAIAFVGIGLSAAVVPARRAARVDPAAVLRGD